jgi:hypothetical protein
MTGMKLSWYRTTRGFISVVQCVLMLKSDVITLYCPAGLVSPESIFKPVSALHLQVERDKTPLSGKDR